MKKILNLEISHKKQKPGIRKSLPKSDERCRMGRISVGEDKLKGLCYVFFVENAKLRPLILIVHMLFPFIMVEKNTLENLRPSCSTCNLSMGTEDLEEFKASLLEFKTKKAKKV